MDVEISMAGVSEEWEPLGPSDEMCGSLYIDAMKSSSSGMGGLTQELATEVSQALEEMTSSWDTSSYAGGGSHPISVPDYLKIDPSDIQKVRLIGKGGFADVYEATWSGVRCAVKRFSTSYSLELVSLVQQELHFLIELRHPHIVRLMGLSVDSQQRCSIVMELMSSSLRALIEKRIVEKKEKGNLVPVVPFTIPEALDIMTKMALGMWFLHSKGVSHRDLKSHNVLVEGSGGYFEVKIVDFGVSLHIDTSGMQTMSVVGTGFWRAPEILRLKLDKSGKPDLKAADVYSFAMTCYEVLTGKLPFQGQLGVGRKEEGRVIAGLRPELPGNLDGDLTRLINACWDPDPNLRPNFENICKELFFMRSKMFAVGTNLSFRNGVTLSLFKWTFQEVCGACSRLLDRVLRKGQYTSSLAYDSSPWATEGDESSSGEGENEGNGSQRSINDTLAKLKDRFKLLSFIEPRNLKNPRLIGRGASATIWSVTWLGCSFAVKRFRVPSHLEVFEYLARELEFLMTLCHPHIVQLVGLSVGSNQNCMIVMELMDSNLRQLIDSRMQDRSRVPLDIYEKGFLEYGVVPFDLHESMLIIKKIALGMAFLHSRDVVHRDLKSSNVLIRELHPGRFDVKIVDFGLSRYFDKSKTREGKISVGEPDWGDIGVGTGFWRAPEVLPTSDDDSYKEANPKAADVYSFAMTCYEVLTGGVPMAELRRIDYDKVIKGYRPMLPSNICPIDLKVLIEQCWCGEPEYRPDFIYICEQLQRIEQALLSSAS